MSQGRKMTDTDRKTLRISQEIYKLRIDNRKPAHEVVVEMLRETIYSLFDETKIVLGGVLGIGVLSALLELLKRMIIPEKHFWEMVGEIRAIKKMCPEENAEQLIPEKFFMILHMSQPWWGASKAEELKQKANIRTVRDFKNFICGEAGLGDNVKFRSCSDRHQKFWAKLNGLVKTEIPLSSALLPDVDEAVFLTDEKWEQLEAEFRQL